MTKKGIEPTPERDIEVKEVVSSSSSSKKGGTGLKLGKRGSEQKDY
jgi:hypothetical protein